jgi:hypothetical protein
MTDLLEEAADALEHRLFFDQLGARYTELREDREAWAQIEAERAGESPSLADGSRWARGAARFGSLTSARRLAASSPGGDPQSSFLPTVSMTAAPGL